MLLVSSCVPLSHYLAVYARDVVPVETQKLTLAHHRVSSSSVIRACYKRVVGLNSISFVFKNVSHPQLKELNS